MANQRIVRPMDAVSVELSRTHIRQITVPDVVRLFFENNSLSFRAISRKIEQAQFHSSRMFGKQSKIHSATVPGSTQRKWLSRPDSRLHGKVHERVQFVCDDRLGGC